MVAGIFAFVPVEQASTVHGTITGSGDIDNTELNTALTTINNFLDTEIGTPVGSLAAEADATQDQLALLVASGNAAEIAGTTVSSTLTPIAAAAALSGIAYITVDVTSSNTAQVGGADTIEVRTGSTVLCTLLDSIALSTCFGDHTSANAITAVEVDAGADGTDAAFTVVVSVIGTSTDTT